MKKFLKNAIQAVATYWGLTPYDVVKCFLQAFIFATITAASIYPFFWLVVKIGELIGRI